MTLAFSTQINGKPTFFPEKIISGLDIPDYKKFTLYDLLAEVMPASEEEFIDGATNPLFPHIPKITTIREDKHNRWKAGMDIHFVINNRQPDRFQFAPVVKCISTQEIKIIYDPEFCEQYYSEPTIMIDGRALCLNEMDILSKRDGFETIQDFLTWFDKDFTGKIIHWTNLKY